MKILIDTTSLTKGGGQKVGWNFVNQILNHSQNGIEFSFFCAKGSIIHEYLQKNNAEDVYVSPNNTLKRIFWQIFRAPSILKKIKPDVIYSVFGSSIYPKKYCQVCGEAASNLFFPEIDFWCELSCWKKVLKRWKDQYRIFMLNRANGVIFENECMLERCANLYPEVFKRSCFIKPAINKSESIAASDSLSARSCKHIPSVLMLCSWQPNKNYTIMPAVIKILKGSNYPVRFMFSVSQKDQNPEASKFNNLLKGYSVEDSVDFLGTVTPDKIPETYARADAVLLLSKLESFSNNIIEAWTFQRPLIVSDMEWSHSIIEDAGVYVNRDNANQIAEAIRTVCSNSQLRKKLIDNGTRVLQSYPDISEHVQEIVAFLKKTANVFKNNQMISK